MAGKLKVTQTRSTISHIARNRATVKALGLHGIGSTSIVTDNDATRGMVRQVRFLVTVEEIADDEGRPPRLEPAPARGEGMKLHDLRPAEGSRKERTRVGRGIAAGKGKTAGRGTKGQKARAGGSIPPWFEGGQTPLHQRIPKLRGFKNRFKIEYEIVNVGAIAAAAERGAFEAEAADAKPTAKTKAPAQITVNQDILRAVGLVRSLDKPLKILGNGELSTPLFVVADAFTASARTKIEAAGGTVNVLEVPTDAAQGDRRRVGRGADGAQAVAWRPGGDREGSQGPDRACRDRRGRRSRGRGAQEVARQGRTPSRGRGRGADGDRRDGRADAETPSAETPATRRPSPRRADRRGRGRTPADGRRCAERDAKPKPRREARPPRPTPSRRPSRRRRPTRRRRARPPTRPRPRPATTPNPCSNPS